MRLADDVVVLDSPLKVSPAVRVAWYVPVPLLGTQRLPASGRLENPEWAPLGAVTVSATNVPGGLSRQSQLTSIGCDAGDPPTMLRLAICGVTTSRPALRVNALLNPSSLPLAGSWLRARRQSGGRP